jgi:hypothetical protein
MTLTLYMSLKPSASRHRIKTDNGDRFCRVVGSVDKDPGGAEPDEQRVCEIEAEGPLPFQDFCREQLQKAGL